MSEAERTTKAETLERRLNELRLVATEWARMDFPAADAEVEGDCRRTIAQIDRKECLA